MPIGPLFIFGRACLIVWSAGHFVIDEPPAPATAPAQAAQAAQAAPAIPPAADGPVDRFHDASDLLGQLENADRDMDSLSAQIKYTKRFADILGGDEQEWRGQLYFLVEPNAGPDGKPLRTFAVTFDTLKIGDALRHEVKQYVFDGVWFVERNETQKQFFKRRVVPPGQVADPLRIGEGPFPLPIGQKRADILSRFDASLLPPGNGFEDGKIPAFVTGTVQLRLVPKPGTSESRDFAEIRLWYRTADLLPRMARTRAAQGAASEVVLINQRVHKRNDPKDKPVLVNPAEDNMPVDSKVVFGTDPPAAGAGWDVDIRPEFRGNP